MLTRASFVALVCIASLELATITQAKNYKLVAEGYEVVNDPSFMLQTVKLRVGKYNATTYVTNGIFNCTQDLPDNTMIRLTAYQLMNSNKYSKIPVGPPPIHLCKFIEGDKTYYPAMLRKSNLPSKCPVRKGVYELSDFLWEFENSPEQLPGERWRVVCEFLTGLRSIFKFYGFAYIDRNI